MCLCHYFCPAHCFSTAGFFCQHHESDRTCWMTLWLWWLLLFSACMHACESTHIYVSAQCMSENLYSTFYIEISYKLMKKFSCALFFIPLKENKFRLRQLGHSFSWTNGNFFFSLYFYSVDVVIVYLSCSQ